jgi:hypothetical protein
MQRALPLYGAPSKIPTLSVPFRPVFVLQVRSRLYVEGV